MCTETLFTETLYLLDVLEESHTAQLLLDYYCTRIEVSVLRGAGA